MSTMVYVIFTLIGFFLGLVTGIIVTIRYLGK